MFIYFYTYVINNNHKSNLVRLKFFKLILASHMHAIKKHTYIDMKYFLNQNLKIIHIPLKTLCV